MESRLGSNPHRGLATLIIAAMAFLANASTVVACDPPPADTTLHNWTLGPQNARNASPEEWSSMLSTVDFFYPGSTYGQLCWYALSWYNVFPPLYLGNELACQCSISGGCAPPPCSNTCFFLPYIIPTQDEWTNALTLILEYYPTADYATVATYAYAWFNYLEPAPTCPCPPACSPAACTPSSPPVCTPSSPPVCTPSSPPACTPSCAPACNSGCPPAPMGYVPTQEEWDFAISYVHIYYSYVPYSTLAIIAAAWFEYVPLY